MILFVFCQRLVKVPVLCISKQYGICIYIMVQNYVPYTCRNYCLFPLVLSVPRVVVQNSETASRHHAPPPARSRIWFSCRSPLKRLYLPSRSRIYSCAEAYGCSYAPHERSGHHWLSTPLYHKLS